MWVLARAIDYHPRNPWAVIWCALSPWDELFIYRNWTVDTNKWVNTAIAERVAKLSGGEKYRCNLIDPLANSVQTNTGKTVVEDLNGAFFRLRKAGVGAGGYWEPYDTKGTVGRDALRERLRNSVTVGRPFNNERFDKGVRTYLPTAWVFKSCKEVAISLKHWRYEDWASSKVLVTKDRKESPAQKFSHYPTAIEGLLKDKRFRARKELAHKTTRERLGPEYFKDRG